MQRRQVDRHDVQSIVQVLSKGAGINLIEQIAVGGGYDATIDSNCLRVANSLELLLLKHSQQLDLQRVAHRVDLVEKNCAAMCGLEPAGAILMRAGESSLHVAEQFAFEQAFAERSTVDAYEGTGGAWAEFVQGVSHQFLARSGFTEQEHSGRRGRDLPRQAIDRIHCGTVANHSVQNRGRRSTVGR